MKKITSVCPYCGAGCKLKLVVDNNKIIRAEAADGVTNQNQLCLKGYYGWDFLNDTQLLTPRLKQPMIRYQKGGAFTPVSWQEAIRYTASKLKEIKEKHGPRAIMTTGSSRGTGNETNYVMQKFARAVLNTNNVDCCARVCHGPSVAGLQQALGNGAMSNSISDIENSKCLLVFGYNCADSHPIVARRVIKARDNGAKIIVCDPRRIETARIADRHLQLNNGSNMALVNAFGYVLLEEELYNKTYVERYTEGLDAYREAVKDYAPEAVEAIADKTIKRKTGARGLRAIMESVMMDLMFKIPSDETIATCTITKDTVEGTGEPELTYREEVRGRRKHRISKIEETA